MKCRDYRQQKGTFGVVWNIIKQAIHIFHIRDDASMKPHTNTNTNTRAMCSNELLRCTGHAQRVDDQRLPYDHGKQKRKANEEGETEADI